MPIELKEANIFHIREAFSRRNTLASATLTKQNAPYRKIKLLLEILEEKKLNSIFQLFLWNLHSQSNDFIVYSWAEDLYAYAICHSWLEQNKQPMFALCSVVFYTSQRMKEFADESIS